MKYISGKGTTAICIECNRPFVRPTTLHRKICGVPCNRVRNMRKARERRARAKAERSIGQ